MMLTFASAILAHVAIRCSAECPDFAHIAGFAEPVVGAAVPEAPTGFSDQATSLRRGLRTGRAGSIDVRRFVGQRQCDIVGHRDRRTEMAVLYRRPGPVGSGGLAGSDLLWIG